MICLVQNFSRTPNTAHAAVYKVWSRPDSCFGFLTQYAPLFSFHPQMRVWGVWWAGRVSRYSRDCSNGLFAVFPSEIECLHLPFSRSSCSSNCLLYSCEPRAWFLFFSLRLIDFFIGSQVTIESLISVLTHFFLNGELMSRDFHF